MNAVDYMASESTLIEIRSRETEFKPLKELSIGTENREMAEHFFPSILLIILVYFIIEKKSIAEKF